MGFATAISVPPRGGRSSCGRAIVDVIVFVADDVYVAVVDDIAAVDVNGADVTAVADVAAIY